MREEPESDLAWLELQVRCLYRHDPRGRLVAARQPSPLAAPRFHLGRSRHGNLWRFRDDVPRPVVVELSRLAGREPPLDAAGPEEPPPPDRLEPIRRILSADAPITGEHRGPAFRFPVDASEGGPVDAGLTPVDAGRAVRLKPGAEGAAPLRPHFPELARELADDLAVQPVTAVLVEGVAVSCCCSARVLALAGGGIAAEAGVETHADHRRAGHAAAAVARWAGCVRAQGGTPLYSTAWENVGSRHVARRLGLIFYGEDLSLG